MSEHNSTELPLEETVWTQKVSWIDKVPRSVGIAMVLGAFLFLWWFLSTSGLVPSIILPTPMETLDDLIFVTENVLRGDYIASSLWTTMRTIFFGYLLAIVIGFGLGVLVGETGFGERSVMPLLVGLDTMPKVAFAPLFVAWLGFGIASKVALATFIATFPIIVGTAAGMHSADQNARMLFQSMGASRWQTLWKMKLPTGLPQIFTGLKIGAVGVMAGAITGEFIGGGKGVGELVRLAATQLDTPRVFSLIIYLSVIGMLLYALVVWVQRWIVFWKKEQVLANP